MSICGELCQVEKRSKQDEIFVNVSRLQKRYHLVKKKIKVRFSTWTFFSKPLVWGDSILGLSSRVLAAPTFLATAHWDDNLKQEKAMMGRQLFQQVDLSCRMVVDSWGSSHDFSSESRG